MAISMLRFVNIFLAAILAGVSFGIWIGFNPSTLSPSTYVEQQQNMLRALKVLMVSLVVITTVITLIHAFSQKNNKSVFITLLVSAAFFIACILITGLAIKPIDDMVMTWKIDSLPDNWTALRDKWSSLHKMRTITELIGLSLVTWVSIKKGNNA